MGVRLLSRAVHPKRRRAASVAVTVTTAAAAVAPADAPAVEPVPTTARPTRQPLRATVAADTGRAPAPGGPKQGQGAGRPPTRLATTAAVKTANTAMASTAGHEWPRTVT